MMDKKEIYYKYANLPEEDGTFADYFTYYLAHPQTDKAVLQRACEEFSSYVNFCMDIVVKYKSKNQNKYLQVTFDDTDELDFNDYKISFFWEGIDIYRDTDLSQMDIENIEGLMKMHLLKEGYRVIFKRLLRGETFLG